MELVAGMVPSSTARPQPIPYFTKYPEDEDNIVFSMKGYFRAMSPDGSREGITNSIEICLGLLDGKMSIDIFSPARVDPTVLIEGTVTEYIKAKNIGGVALSEVNAIHHPKSSFRSFHCGTGGWVLALLTGHSDQRGRRYLCRAWHSCYRLPPFISSVLDWPGTKS